MKQVSRQVEFIHLLFSSTHKTAAASNKLLVLALVFALALCDSTALDTSTCENSPISMLNCLDTFDSYARDQ